MTDSSGIAIIDDPNFDWESVDELSQRLRREALQAMKDEPELTMLLKNTVLAPGIKTFEDAVACTVAYRMLLHPCHGKPTPAQLAQQQQPAAPLQFCPYVLRGILASALESDHTEYGHTMKEAVRQDALAVIDRDPAVDSLLEVVIFLKGFAALVCHRAAHFKWHSAVHTNKKSLTALWLQSQASAVFGLDIHPAATLGAGILLDHGTGIVMGETAVVGDGCTILHGVTLGGTGKETGDRHPKVGHDVLIGANASLLGNIPIGHGAKIGAGSIVLGPIPSGATAVGAPAKIIGRAKEAKPGTERDYALQKVQMQNFPHSDTSTTESSTEDDVDVDDDNLSTSSGENQNNTVENDNITKKEEKTDDGIVQDHPDDIMALPQHHTRGRPTTRRVHHRASICPYRDFSRMESFAPPGTVTLSTLQKIFKPLQWTLGEIGEILFALDEQSHGYLEPNVLLDNKKNTKQTLLSKTDSPEARIDEFLQTFAEHWPKAKHETERRASTAHRTGHRHASAPVVTKTTQQPQAIAAS